MTADFRALYEQEDLLEQTIAGYENELSYNYPFISVISEGMPPPGPNFMRAACMGIYDADWGSAKNEKMMESIKKSKKNKDDLDANLLKEVNKLYYRALYDSNFYLPVLAKGQQQYVHFHIGHLWSKDLTGPVLSDTVVIGKNPGKYEVEDSCNFSGPSSKLFYDILQEYECPSSDDWYITSVVRFPNPNVKTGNTTLAADWIKDCLPLLHMELRIIRPKFIWCLGSEAIRTIIGKGNTTSNAIGRKYEYLIPYPGSKPHKSTVVCSMHPAAVEWSPEKVDDLKTGMYYCVNVLKGKDEELAKAEEDVEHDVIHSIDELKRLVDKLLKEERREFAIDLEWHGEYPSEPESYLRTIQFSWEFKKAACIALTNPGGSWYFDGTLDQIQNELHRLWKRDNVRIIGHYLIADLPWLIQYGFEYLVDKFDAPADEEDLSVLGYEKTKYEGGFDTGLAAHAYNETATFDLESQAFKYTTCGKYSHSIETWKEKYCKENKIKKTKLGGFGQVPNEILWPYALKDADVSFRLYLKYNGLPDKPGLLDCDNFGRNCREAFWRSQAASNTFLEARLTGVVIDRERAEQTRQDFNITKEKILEEIRENLNWEEFNPNSSYHCREALFGEAYNGKIKKAENLISTFTEEMPAVRIRPAKAISLFMRPYKTTGQKPKLWSRVIKDGEVNEYTPAVDKETLSILGAENDTVSLLRDYKFIDQVTKAVLKDPRCVSKSSDVYEYDDDGNPVYDKGLLSYICSDGRVHTNYSQTKETGRAATWSPTLQNLSKKREDDYKRILKDMYQHSIRSIITVPDDWVLIEADYVTAEVAAAAWMSFDENLMDHAARSSLPESHPNHYDIHSQIAVKTFRLDCDPVKSALEKAGFAKFRIAAKTRFFGWFYGQGIIAAWRKIKEEGVDITTDDVEILTEELENTYPDVVQFFKRAYRRVENPGWVCNAFGRYRRFYPSNEDGVLQSQQRECANFLIQSLVSDAMSTAFYNFRVFRKKNPEYRFRVNLQLHDAALIECPIEEVPYVYDTVIPECMSANVPITPCELDGQIRNDGPYYFGVDRSIYKHWGEKLPKSFMEKYAFDKLGA